MHEAQGGMARGAEQVAWAVAPAVATREGRRTETAHGELLGRVAILLARSTALAIRKHGRIASTFPPALWAAVQQALVEGVGVGEDVAGADVATADAG